MTLWNIEQGLASLMEARAECDGEELLAVDQAIADYIKAEVQKVDGIRSMVRYLETMRDAAKAEAVAMKERQERFQTQLNVLKSSIQLTMEERGLKKLEGRTGTIALKGNGGRQPVVVSNEDLLPDEYWLMTVKMTAQQWRDMTHDLAELPGIREVQKSPNLTKIGADLEAGKGVPGATLAPRGKHVEIK